MDCTQPGQRIAALPFCFLFAEQMLHNDAHAGKTWSCSIQNQQETAFVDSLLVLLNDDLLRWVLYLYKNYFFFIFCFLNQSVEMKESFYARNNLLRINIVLSAVWLAALFPSTVATCYIQPAKAEGCTLAQRQIFELMAIRLKVAQKATFQLCMML